MLDIIKRTKKDCLKKKPHERYQNLSDGEKVKRHLYGHEQCNYLPEDKRKRLIEYRKKRKTLDFYSDNNRTQDFSG